MYKILYITGPKILVPMVSTYTSVSGGVGTVLIFFEDLVRFTGGYKILLLESKEEADRVVSLIVKKQTRIYSKYIDWQKWETLDTPIIREELEVIEDV